MASIILTLSGSDSYWCGLCIQEGVVSRDLPPQGPHKPLSQLSQATHLMGFFSFSFPKWPNQESQVDRVSGNVQHPSHPFFLQSCLRFVIFKDANIFIADFYFSNIGEKLQTRRLKSW